ncbi:MAG TPA: hypothetical protein VGR06_11890, partial [Actinophytocola sp.]|nr:hypothetical protein [Actinophytocola sp.]
MFIEIPPELNWLVYIIVGENWPKGDEEAMFRLGEAWAGLAEDVEAVDGQVNTASQGIQNAGEGLSFDAAKEYFSAITDPEKGMAGLRKACLAYADLCYKTGLAIQYAKLMILVMAAYLMLQLLKLAWLSLLTGGAFMNMAPVHVKIAQLTAEAILKRVVSSIFVGTAFMVGLDAIVQLIQFMKKDRHEWDKDSTKNMAIVGALGGVVNLGLSGMKKFLIPKAWTKEGIGGYIAHLLIEGLGEGIPETIAETISEGGPKDGFFGGFVSGAVTEGNIEYFLHKKSKKYSDMKTLGIASPFLGALKNMAFNIPKPPDFALDPGAGGQAPGTKPPNGTAETPPADEPPPAYQPPTYLPPADEPPAYAPPVLPATPVTPPVLPGPILDTPIPGEFTAPVLHPTAPPAGQAPAGQTPAGQTPDPQNQPAATGRGGPSAGGIAKALSTSVPQTQTGPQAPASGSEPTPVSSATPATKAPVASSPQAAIPSGPDAPVTPRSGAPIVPETTQTATQGQGQSATQGQGQSATQGQGQSATQGQGQSATQGQGQAAVEPSAVANLVGEVDQLRGGLDETIAALPDAQREAFERELGALTGQIDALTAGSQPLNPAEVGRLQDIHDQIAALAGDIDQWVEIGEAIDPAQYGLATDHRFST